MKKFITIILFCFCYSTHVCANVEKSQIVSTNLIMWNTQAAITRFEAAKYKNDFYQLVNFYQPQINPLYCAVASSVIVLNALKYGNIASQKQLEVQVPESLGGGSIPYNLYSQINFLNAATNKIKLREIIELKKPKEIKNGKEVFDAGISLSNLHDILKNVYKVKVQMVYANKDNAKSVNKFRQDLKEVLSDNKNFIIANFDGKVLGSNTGGHMSPLAAYDQETDSVLILDVALHKDLWYFVPLSKLYEAMNSKDADHYRGYLIVGK